MHFSNTYKLIKKIEHQFTAYPYYQEKLGGKNLAIIIQIVKVFLPNLS